VTASLREALQEIGERMPPARLPGDVWHRGRRRRYQGRIAGAGTALLCLVGLAVLPGLGGGAQPAEGATAVIPSSVERPYPWQATVGASPPGRASVLFGGDSLGLGSDPFETEGGKLAVVGRGGDYRTLRYTTEKQRAGLDVRLSPDGRLVAQSELHDGPAGWLVVTDLRTGRSRGYGNGPAACCYEVAAWRPDSGAVLVQHRVGENSQLTLVDLASGAELPIDGPAPRDVNRFAWAAAFAPDGASFVAAFPAGGGTELRAFDATGHRRWIHDLGARRLAGAGAYTADGSAIAVLTMTGCADDCDLAQLAERRWSVSYLDAATGAERGGPAVPAVGGAAVRALGWHGDALVVVRYEAGTALVSGLDETGWSQTRHVQVLTLRPGAEPQVVLDPPAHVNSIDVAQDLIRDGEFGGPVPPASMLPARWSVLGQLGLCLLLPLAAVTAAVVLIRRRVLRRRKAAARA
jgi:hypothetical protein